MPAWKNYAGADEIRKALCGEKIDLWFPSSTEESADAAKTAGSARKAPIITPASLEYDLLDTEQIPSRL
jgi:hypothetical protein